MSTRTVTICDCCKRELDFVADKDKFLTVIVGDGNYQHVCTVCANKNISRKLTGTASSAARLQILDALLGKGT